MDQAKSHFLELAHLKGGGGVWYPMYREVWRAVPVFCPCTAPSALLRSTVQSWRIPIDQNESSSTGPCAL